MDEDNLKIVDTSDVLTKEELIELKKLAAMSKMAKLIFDCAVTAVGLRKLGEIARRGSRCFRPLSVREDYAHIAKQGGSNFVDPTSRSEDITHLADLSYKNMIERQDADRSV